MPNLTTWSNCPENFLNLINEPAQSVVLFSQSWDYIFMGLLKNASASIMGVKKGIISTIKNSHGKIFSHIEKKNT